MKMANNVIMFLSRGPVCGFFSGHALAIDGGAGCNVTYAREITLLRTYTSLSLIDQHRNTHDEVTNASVLLSCGDTCGFPNGHSLRRLTRVRDAT